VRRTPILLLAALVLVQEPADLSTATLDRWRAFVRPSDAELAYAEIPWIADLAGGLAAAAREGKPLLLWAMNGHPLGCT